KAVEHRHCLDVGLDAGAAARIRAGDDQHPAAHRLLGGPDRARTGWPLVVFGGVAGGLDRLADIADDAAEQLLVLALSHHADHRLGAGGPDDEPAVSAEPRIAGDDRLLHRPPLERLAPAEADIAKELGNRGEDPAHLARLL